MILAQILIALVIGLLFSVVFNLVSGGREGVSGLFFVFLLFFLLAWAGGMWLQPWGPMLFGVYWLPSIVVTLLIFLLIASFTPRTPRTRREARDQLEARQTAVAAFGLLFWIAVAGLIVSVVLAYLV